MRIYGVDFTSAPSQGKARGKARGKAITVAEGELAGDALRIVRPPLKVRTFPAFEACLAAPGPWIAGLDFPFGQPRRLVRDLEWPPDWAGYVEEVAGMGRERFGERLEMYRASRPAGDKEHLRACDRPARAKSPMKWYGVPVGKMFYEGAPRLLRSEVSVLPCRPLPGADRIAVEAYPALVARWLTGPRQGYKASKGRATSKQEAARREIVRGLASDRLASRYGFRVELPGILATELVGDPTADLLDAVLAAVQAAWAWSRREDGFGIPPDADPAEGWIVDPATAERPRR
jgi:hypothetical protein